MLEEVSMSCLVSPTQQQSSTQTGALWVLCGLDIYAVLFILFTNNKVSSWRDLETTIFVKWGSEFNM